MVSPESEAVLLRELGEIKRTLGSIEASLEHHEERDEERHQDTSDRLDKIENKADITGRQEVERVHSRAERLEAETKLLAAAHASAEKVAAEKVALEQAAVRKERRDRIEKVAIAIVGAVLAIATSAAAHAFGLK